MRRALTQPEFHNNQERWLLTYADMITLLTAFFLMLYSMSVMSKGKFSAMATSVRSGFGDALHRGPSLLNGGGAHTRTTGDSADGPYQQYQQAMRDLTQYVEQNQWKGQVSTRADERGVIISLLSDNALFPRGQALLRPASLPLLQRVAKVLATAPNNVQIEGHTCDLPIHSAQFPSNWELSSGRAGTVLRYFTEQAGLPNRRFVASGYADTHPLNPNDSEASRARNRRVDIVLLKTEAQREDELRRQAEIRRVMASSDTPAADAAAETNSAASQTPDRAPLAPTAK